MTANAKCPRCGIPLRAPGMFSSAWRCAVHGDVQPMAPPVLPTGEHLRWLATHSTVPVWVPWPLPAGWLVTGLTWVGDERSSVRAVATACTGPNPLGGTGDLVLVAEELGIELGARYACCPGPDPGEQLASSPADAKIEASGHPTPLWSVAGPDGQSAYAGAAGGVWLWLVLWPETTDLVMLAPLTLVDARDAGLSLDLPTGALCPRL